MNFVTGSPLDHVVVTPENQKVIVTGSIRFGCHLISSTITNPTITWSFKDASGQVKEVVSNYAQSNDLILPITDAKKEQAGQYVCQADLGDRIVTAEATLTVYNKSKGFLSEFDYFPHQKDKLNIVFKT